MSKELLTLPFKIPDEWVIRRFDLDDIFVQDPAFVFTIAVKRSCDNLNIVCTYSTMNFSTYIYSPLNSSPKVSLTFTKVQKKLIELGVLTGTPTTNFSLKDWS